MSDESKAAAIIATIGAALSLLPGIASAKNLLFGKREVLPGNYPCNTRRKKGGRVKCKACGGTWVLTEDNNPWPAICPNKPEEQTNE